MIKKYLIDIVVFCLFIIFILGFNYQFTHADFSKNDEFKNVKYVINSTIDADIVFNGTSRTVTDIHPSTIDSLLSVSSYNLGLAGCSFPYTSAYLKTYLLKNAPPKILILECDMINLTSHSNLQSIYYPERFFLNLHDKFFYQELKSFEPDFLYIKYFPLLGYIKTSEKFKLEFLKSTIQQGFDEQDMNQRSFVKGWFENSVSWSEKSDFFLAELTKTYRYFNFDPISKNCVEEIIGYCIKNKIKLVLIQLPVYYESVKNTKNIEVYYNYIDSLIDIHPQISFINYIEDSLSYNKKYFSDMNHLNTEGAVIMSKKLSKELKGFL